jgi:hypothetical protein
VWIFKVMRAWKYHNQLLRQGLKTLILRSPNSKDFLTLLAKQATTSRVSVEQKTCQNLDSDSQTSISDEPEATRRWMILLHRGNHDPQDAQRGPKGQSRKNHRWAHWGNYRVIRVRIWRKTSAALNGLSLQTTLYDLICSVFREKKQLIHRQSNFQKTSLVCGIHPFLSKEEIFTGGFCCCWCVCVCMWGGGILTFFSLSSLFLSCSLIIISYILIIRIYLEYNSPLSYLASFSFPFPTCLSLYYLIINTYNLENNFKLLVYPTSYFFPFPTLLVL